MVQACLFMAPPPVLLRPRRPVRRRMWKAAGRAVTQQRTRRPMRTTRPANVCPGPAGGSCSRPRGALSRLRASRCRSATRHVEARSVNTRRTRWSCACCVVSCACRVRVVCVSCRVLCRVVSCRVLCRVSYLELDVLEDGVLEEGRHGGGHLLRQGLLPAARAAEETAHDPLLLPTHHPPTN